VMKNRARESRKRSCHLKGRGSAMYVCVLALISFLGLCLSQLSFGRKGQDLEIS